MTIRLSKTTGDTRGQASRPPTAAETETEHLPQPAAEIAYTQKAANLTQPASESEGGNLQQVVGDIPGRHTFQMLLCLSAVDDRLRHADDQFSIGIILCKSRDKVTVEYALRDTRKPIGVSEYRLTEALPQELKPSLPTIEELEAELSSVPTDIRRHLEDLGHGG